MAVMTKLSPDELAAKIVKYDVLPVFSADDPKGGWEAWLVKTIAERIRTELDVRSVRRNARD